MADTATASVLEAQQVEQDNSISELTDGVVKIAVTADTPAGASVSQESHRPRYIYTRKQLAYLSKSPLVKVPDDMPPFKSWFGSVVNGYSFAGQYLRQPLSHSENGASRMARRRRKTMKQRALMEGFETEGECLCFGSYFVRPLNAILRFRREVDEGGKFNLCSACFFLSLVVH